MYDFAVRYNPEKETQEQLTKKILYSLFIRPIREGKPRVLFMKLLIEGHKKYLDYMFEHLQKEHPKTRQHIKKLLR